MPMDTKRVTTKAALEGDEGRLTAVISTFNVIDSDQDVVLPSAFTPGQRVPMVWAHDWSKIIGAGEIRVEPDRAVWDGALFLDTSGGLDAYRTIKAMGDLMEYSWGFRIRKAEPGVLQDQPVRFIQQTEVFEASPVLIGANRETYTLAIKSGEQKAAPRGSYEERQERLSAALYERVTGPFNDGYAYILATYDSYIIAEVFQNGERNYWQISYALDEQGMPVLGPFQRVEQTYIPATKGLAYAVHTEHVLASVQEWKERTRSLADLRAKEGRELSAANRRRLTTLAEQMRAVLADVDDLLAATAPRSADDGKGLDGAALLAEFLKIEARLNGVAA